MLLIADARSSGAWLRSGVGWTDIVLIRHMDLTFSFQVKQVYYSRGPWRSEVQHEPCSCKSIPLCLPAFDGCPLTLVRCNITSNIHASSNPDQV